MDIKRVFQIIFFLETLCLILAPPEILARPNPKDQIAVAVERYLEQAIKALAPRFASVDDLAKTLNTPEQAFAWVKRETTMLPYRGILRGAEGVFFERAGNSLDRALLLAKLIQKRRTQVRLAHATLSVAQAQEVLTGRPTQVADDIVESLPEVVTGITKHLGANHELQSFVKERLQRESARLEKVVDSLYTQNEELAHSLLGLLQQAGIQTFASSVFAGEAQTEALRDHWWVQAKTEEGSWIDLDVSTRSPGEVRSATFKYHLPDLLDNSLKHRVQLKLVLGIDTGKEIHEILLLKKEIDASTTQTSHGALQRILLTQVPSALPSKSDLASFFSNQKGVSPKFQTWVPLLRVGAEVVSGQAFTLSGNTVELSKQQLNKVISGEPILVGAALEKGAQAISLFESLPDGSSSKKKATSDKNNFRLVFERLDYQLLIPGKKPLKFQRMIFDRRNIGPNVFSFEKEDMRGHIVSLFLRQQIHIFTTQLHERRALQIFAQGLRDVTKTVHAYAGDKSPDKQSAQNMIRFVPELVAYRLSRALLNPHSNVVYINQPQILSFWQRTLFDNDTLRLNYELDVVSHGVESFEENPEQYFEAFFMQGVADTLVEGAVFRNQHVVNAAMQFLEDKKSRRKWDVIRSQKELPKGIATNTQTLIESALGEGHVIIAPHVVQDANSYLWWQINPHTGETLGYGPRRTGTSSVEYFFQLVNVLLCLESMISPHIGGSPGGGAVLLSAMVLPFCIIGGSLGLPGAPHLIEAGALGSITATKLGAIVALIGDILGRLPTYIP